MDVEQREDVVSGFAFYSERDAGLAEQERQKIAYLDKELPTEGSPNSWDPAVGDLCFYIPWGNLCFFYQDFRYSESLVPLGTVESGAESLEQLSGVSHVIAEAAE